METNYTQTLTPTKETMWMLVNDIYEKSMRIKTRERDLYEKLFGLWEDEWQLEEKEVSIEQKLFRIRGVLWKVLNRLDETINNLD